MAKYIFEQGDFNAYMVDSLYRAKQPIMGGIGDVPIIAHFYLFANTQNVQKQARPQMTQMTPNDKLSIK